MSPNKPHTRRLPNGTIIKGGYESAYNGSAFKDALKWAKQCAKRCKGSVFVSVNNKFKKL